MREKPLKPEVNVCKTRLSFLLFHKAVKELKSKKFKTLHHPGSLISNNAYLCHAKACFLIQNKNWFT